MVMVQLLVLQLVLIIFRKMEKMKKKSSKVLFLMKCFKKVSILVKNLEKVLTDLSNDIRDADNLTVFETLRFT